MTTTWTPVEDGLPRRGRSCRLMVDGSEQLGFYGRVTEPRFPYAPVGERCWRQMDGEPMTGQPTHWMYVEDHNRALGEEHDR